MIKSYAVVTKVKNLGHSAPRFFSSLSEAYKAHISALSEYKGDRGDVECFCIGEFDHDAGKCDLYSVPVKIDLETCENEEDFDRMLFELVQTYFTNNEKSMYQLALKIPASGKEDE